MVDPRFEPGRLQEATRWLLVVLVGACVLAAGVIAVSDVPGLIGRRWQVVGAVSAAVTVLVLVIGLLAVVRAMGPDGEETGEAVPPADPPAPASPAPTTPLAIPTSTLGEVVGEGGAESGAQGDVDGVPADAGVAVPVLDGGIPNATSGAAAEPLVLPPPSPAAESRRAHRHAARRYQRARTTVTVAVLVAFLGMVGMTAAAVVDGNNVERRTRAQLEAQLTADEDGPISEPQSVAVQLTTAGLRRVADAMGCTGATIGARPVNGWAVAGTYRNPALVLFGPVPGCRNIEIALTPTDGFVYPSIPGPFVTTTVPAATSTSTSVAGSQAVNPGGQAAIPPTTAAG